MSIPQQGNKVIEHYHDLVEYLEQGCKPKNQWRIGTEHEKFGFVQSNRNPLPYRGDCSIVALLEGLRDEFSWHPVLEGDNLIGLMKDGANVSLEPGGQIELSGAPLETLHETCDEVNNHLKEVRTIGDLIGAGFMGIGAAPEWSHEQMPILPKGRYQLMTDYMKKVGQLGVQMMYRTCTVQVNLDFSSESDMIRKLRVALALQPIATAFFANSPFFEGKFTDHLSWRSRVWRDLDPDRTGMLPFVFDDGFGFEAWTEYALDVPMYFVFRNNRYLDARGLSFRDFLKGKLPILPGELPLDSDWGDHLTTIFPEARIKRFIEMRGADGGTWGRLCALPALWVGLLYDQDALDEAWQLVKSFDHETREALRVESSRHGFEARVGEIKILDLARKVLAIADRGLQARQKFSSSQPLVDERHFLNALWDSLDTKMTPADELLKKFHGEWGGKLGPIYDECSY
ncbi:MAG: glutamate--cysteine ligase [Rhodobacteraceae bacterium]|nr:glutamate--cysteine ligase [Paracoccaceae bacterium]